MKPKNPLKILFEDVHLCVLSKPAGLLSQGDASGERSLVDLLRIHFGRNYVGLVHRLDRNTSGLMVVGKRSKSADRLSEQLRSGELRRAYIAWVEGQLNELQTWRHELMKDPRTNITHAYSTPRDGSKSAVLRATPLKAESDRTLVRFDLKTGRSHQIRAQASAEGHPLIGDRKYGSRLPPPYFLHSFELAFTHPMTHEPLHFQEWPDWARCIPPPSRPGEP